MGLNNLFSRFKGKGTILSEQEARKEQSEKQLKKLKVHVNPNLPVIEKEALTYIMEPEIVGKRIFCLVAVSAASKGLDKKKLLDWLTEESMADTLSPKERGFLEETNSTNEDSIYFSWQIECAWLLLWALDRIDETLPVDMCNPEHIQMILPEFFTPTAKFRENFKLRSKSEIMDMSDLIYRAHWAIRQNSIDGKTKTGKLNGEVVLEWHRAINWLTNYNPDYGWDDVPTDT